MASITISFRNHQICFIAHDAGRNSGKESKWRGASGHAREITHQHILNFASTLAVQIVGPEMKAFDDVGRGNEEGVAHFGSRNNAVQTFTQLLAVGSIGQLEALRIVERRNRFEPIAPLEKFMERQKCCSQDEETCGRKFGCWSHLIHVSADVSRLTCAALRHENLFSQVAFETNYNRDELVVSRYSVDWRAEI